MGQPLGRREVRQKLSGRHRTGSLPFDSFVCSVNTVRVTRTHSDLIRHWGNTYDTVRPYSPKPNVWWGDSWANNDNRCDNCFQADSTREHRSCRKH